ncbi:MAG: HEAT repeat domain-containing protein [Planctomycetota bacterium]|jgi:hypothetical protein
MSNGTISAILGTVIGLGAGVAGMVAFGNVDQGADEEFAVVSKRNVDLTNERDDLEGQLAAMDKELRKLKEELANARKVADELANEREENPNGDAADLSKKALEAKDAKGAAEEALRIAQAKLEKYEDLMLENGIYEFLTPEQLEARKQEFEAKFETAIAGKDKVAAMEAVKALQMLGPKFFDDAIAMWGVLAADYGVSENWGKGPGELGMSMQEFVSLVPSFEMIEYALTNSKVDSKFRESMLYGLEWRTDEDAAKRTELAGNVLLSSSDGEANGAINALRAIDSPATVRYLTDYVSGNTDSPEGRQAAIRALQTKDTDEAWAAIESASRNDPDPEVKKTAGKAMATRGVSVAGVMITFVDPNAQAGIAGIKLGDIMTKYNGKPTLKLSDINEAKKSVKDGQSVPVVLYRDGKYINLTIGPGQIGINGTEVKPKK